MVTPRSFTPMGINKDDDVVNDVHATRKDHNEGIYTTDYGNKFRNIFDNTHLEFFVFVLYDFLSMQIN